MTPQWEKRTNEKEAECMLMFQNCGIHWNHYCVSVAWNLMYLEYTGINKVVGSLFKSENFPNQLRYSKNLCCFQGQIKQKLITQRSEIFCIISKIWPVCFRWSMSHRKTLKSAKISKQANKTNKTFVPQKLPIQSAWDPKFYFKLSTNKITAGPKQNWRNLVFCETL